MTGVAFLASILLPENIMHSQWFAVLSMFVAVNTVLYLTLAVIKLLPKAYLSDWVDQRNRRAETRSIYPDPEGGAQR
ncbi:MAG: hypothetical protein ACXW2C_07515 [Acidimicrobiia bacterium]